MDLTGCSEPVARSVFLHVCPEEGPPCADPAMSAPPKAGGKSEPGDGA